MSLLHINLGISDNRATEIAEKVERACIAHDKISDRFKVLDQELSDKVEYSYACFLLGDAAGRMHAFSHLGKPVMVQIPAGSNVLDALKKVLGEARSPLEEEFPNVSNIVGQA